MTTSRLVVLLAVVAGGMSAAFILPKAPDNQPSGIRLSLPQYVDQWYGVDQAITDRERAILASDTEFVRKRYTDATGNEIWVTIVLSGHDLDNSIHRPERCLPAQGRTVVGSRQIAIPPSGSNGKALEVTRLRDVRAEQLRNGKKIQVANLNYYWFVGYHRITASHLQRTFLDIYDRVVNGYTQRWAYVTVASDITQGIMPFGLSEADTDKMIQNFIRDIYSEISQLPNEAKTVSVTNRDASNL